MGAASSLGILLVLAVWAGCEVSAPAVEVEAGGMIDAGNVFADTVIADSTNGAIRVCTDLLPACDTVATDSCYPHPALGPNDGTTFTLGPNDLVEVAFRCNFVREEGSANGTSSDDFKIWSTVPDGAKAVVDVSYDGSNYRSLDLLDRSNKGFDLARISVEVIRFIRIRDTGVGGIQIDAVEAL